MTKQTWMLVSDYHTGAVTGLTPDPVNSIQKEVLARYTDALGWFGPRPDVLLHIGDAIDGPDRKSRDITIVSPMEQVEKAAELILMARPRKEIILVAGTAYHTVIDAEDSEKHLAKCLEARTKVKVTLVDKLDTDVNGWFNLTARHFIGASGIPHGRATSPKREQLWAILNAQLDNGARPDLQLYGHTHYYEYNENAFGATMIVPGWQAAGGKFGERKCGGHIDIGLGKLTIQGEREKGWQKQVKLYQARVVSNKGHR